MSKNLNTDVVVRSDAGVLVRAAASARGSEVAEMVLLIGGLLSAIASVVLVAAFADAGWSVAAGGVAVAFVSAVAAAVVAAVRSRDPGRALTARSMRSRFGYEQLRGEHVRVDGFKSWQSLCSLASHIVDVCPQRHSEVRNLLFETGLLLRDAVKCDDLRRQAFRDGDAATAELWEQRTGAAVAAVESVRGQMSAMLAEFATSEQAARLAAGADRLDAMARATLELRTV